jgi:ATP adenylyltransferase
LVVETNKQPTAKLEPMEHLFSPWRMEYIQGDSQVSGCIFCNFTGQQEDVKNLIIYRGDNVFVILNRYPYTSGHLMVVPFAHRSSLELLDPQTRAEMMELASKSVEVLGILYRPQGFNLGINIGSAAGAGIADHVHLHVVPRWGGDTNFMSSVGDTRVLPEALEETYARVLAEWERQATSSK